jgi:hypothetical protein
MGPESNGATAPEEFRKRCQKIITLPTAKFTVRIRKLIGLDYLEMGQLPMISAKGTTKEKREAIEKAVRENQDMQRQMIKGIVQRGVVAPRIHEGAPQDCPADAITIYDLAEDLYWVADEIQKFSGLSEEATQVLQPFSQEESPQAPSP